MTTNDLSRFQLRDRIMIRLCGCRNTEPPHARLAAFVAALEDFFGLDLRNAADLLTYRREVVARCERSPDELALVFRDAALTSIH